MIRALIPGQGMWPAGKVSKIDDLVCIGDRYSHEHCDKHGIRAIVNVAGDVEYNPPDGVEYRHIALSDDENNPCDVVQEATDALAGFVQQGLRTLVHCRAGMSRAPSIVALYYHDYHDWPMNAALDAIKEKRPIVDPGDGMWQTALQCARRTSTT